MKPNQPPQSGTSTVAPKVVSGGELSDILEAIATRRGNQRGPKFVRADVTAKMAAPVPLVSPAKRRGNRQPSKFKQSEVERVLAAIKKSGANIVVDITPDGTIRLVPAPEIAVAQATPNKKRIPL